MGQSPGDLEDYFYARAEHYLTRWDRAMVVSGFVRNCADEVEPIIFGDITSREEKEKALIKLFDAIGRLREPDFFSGKRPPFPIDAIIAREVCDEDK